MARRIIIYILFLATTISCKNSLENIVYNDLSNFDQTLSEGSFSIYDTSTPEILNLLGQYDSLKLSKRNKAYLELVRATAQNKLLLETNDPEQLLNAELYFYQKDKSKYARVKLLQSIFPLFKDHNDTIAFNNLKIAEDVLEEKEIENKELGIIKFLIGINLRKTGNIDLSVRYLSLASQILKDKDRNLYDLSQIELANSFLYNKDTSKFENITNRYLNDTSLSEISYARLYNIRALYYLTKFKIDKTISLKHKQIEKEKYLPSIIKENIAHQNYFLSVLYEKKNLKDSALIYAQKSVRESSNEDLMRRFYFIHLASLYSDMGNYKSAYTLADRAYYVEKENTKILTHKKILELQKKYDYEKQQRKAQKEKSKIIFLLLISISIALLILMAALMWRKRIKKEREADNKRIQQLNIAYTILNKNISLTPEIIKKIDNLAQQNISNNSLYEALDSISVKYRNKYRSNITSIAGHIRETETSKLKKEISLLSDKEIIVFILLSQNFNNSDIAQILSTTPENIRAINTKITKKLTN